MEESEAFQSRTNLELNSYLKLLTFLSATPFLCQGGALHSKHCRNPFGNTQHMWSCITTSDKLVWKGRRHLAKSKFRHRGGVFRPDPTPPPLHIFSDSPPSSQTLFSSSHQFQTFSPPCQQVPPSKIHLEGAMVSSFGLKQTSTSGHKISSVNRSFGILGSIKWECSLLFVCFDSALLYNLGDFSRQFAQVWCH